MKQGTLIFDEYRDCYDIRFNLKDYLGGLCLWQMETHRDGHKQK